MQLAITAAGAWGPGFTDWDALRALLRGGEPAGGDDARGPKPEVIPPNERRRAPLMVRLAVETSWQALQASPLKPQAVTCVFASALGDTDITDYMCRILAGDNKQISPTKFHNSVHNAAAGYWTISTGCMQAANSIAAFDHTFSLALMEAATQCTVEQVPVLLTAFEAPTPVLLRPILFTDEPFSGSLLLHPDPAAGTPVTVRIAGERADWPALRTPSLATLYQRNQPARMLSLLEAWATAPAEGASLRLPMGPAISLDITIGGAA